MIRRWDDRRLDEIRSQAPPKTVTAPNSWGARVTATGHRRSHSPFQAEALP